MVNASSNPPQANPQGTVPTLNDNGFFVWEMPAVLIYLIDKYAQDDSLYPRDVHRRALINQRLMFNSHTFYQRLADFYYPQVMKQTLPDDDAFRRVQEVFHGLEIYLEDNTYTVGESLTLADFALVMTTVAFRLARFPIVSYQNVLRWYDLVAGDLPGWSDMIEEMQVFREFCCIKRKKSVFSP